MKRRLLAAYVLTGSALLTACTGNNESSWPAADADGLFAVSDRE